MKKALVVALASVVIAPWAAGTDVMATPDNSGACSSCHDRDSGVSVQTTFMGCSGSNANYSVTVSNTYSGQEGWALFDAGANVRNGNGMTGSFTVPGGKSYEIWGVSKDSSSMYGSYSTTISAECVGGSCTRTARIERNRTCYDGIDNDCDGTVDSADPDCAQEICDNGWDDDGDGKIDCSDRKDCNKHAACARR